MPQYTLLDPIRIGSDFGQAYELAIEGAALQTSVNQDDFKTITPHLFPCEADSRLYNWLLNEGKGDSWGIFINTSLTLKELAAHLQKLLIVTMQDDGRMVYFRFYDPRVLRTFLPTCHVTQLKELFGPVEVFFCEDTDEDFQLHFSIENEKLKTVKLPITY
ncbi:DUF4123 domain-containing protein [Emticicia sp. 17c]|uniref:DUF4123 domain-containing protein n=1 Tax=Emticicia sp. 17c TaxID=3127704 RepID=UPI00301C332D